MSWKLAVLGAAVLVAAAIVARLAQDEATGTATWDASRAAGFAAYLLLWLSTVSGIAVHFRVRPPATPLSIALEVHRICSALSLSFVACHVAALLLDPVVHFAVIDGFIPFTSAYRPLQVGAGTISLWLQVIVLGTTAAVAWMRYSTWRALHLFAYPCYVLALLHGITSGSDSTQLAAIVMYSVTAAAVAAASFARLLGRGWVAAGEAPTPIG